MRTPSFTEKAPGRSTLLDATNYPEDDSREGLAPPPGWQLFTLKAAIALATFHHSLRDRHAMLCKIEGNAHAIGIGKRRRAHRLRFADELKMSPLTIRCCLFSFSNEPT